jgi:hypothetical protein
MSVAASAAEYGLSGDPSASVPASGFADRTESTNRNQHCRHGGVTPTPMTPSTGASMATGSVSPRHAGVVGEMKSGRGGEVEWRLQRLTRVGNGAHAPTRPACQTNMPHDNGMWAS